MFLYRFAARLLRPQTTLAVLVALAGCFFLAYPATAQQSPEMRATYGRGVHAFFANRPSEADRMFSQVVEAGSTDPNVYYFRAVARMRLGRQYEAEEDMRIGAAFEARDPGNQHAIGRALQRIQGPARRTLERFRRDGRLLQAQQRRQQSQQRYEHLQQRNPKVLRRENPVQLDQLLEPSPQLIAPAEETVTESTPQPTFPLEETVTKSKPSAGDDLFGQPTPEAVAEPAAKEPMTEKPADDLFGEPAPAESTDDPLGETAPAEEAPAEEPMTEKPADDLFGEPAPAEPVAAEAEKTDDLFGATSEDSTSTSSTLTTPDRAESGNLTGVLKRVVTNAIPWRGIQLPKIGLPGVPDSADTAQPADNFEFGPAGDQPTTAGEPKKGTADDLFGDAAPEAESTDDPFGSFLETEEASNNEEMPTEDNSTPSSDDDPFGDF